MKKDDSDLVHDILDHCRIIMEETSMCESVQEALEQSRLLRAGLERWVMNIGEASNRISQPFREAHPSVPWSQIIGLRNILAHDYDGIAEMALANVVQLHIPELHAYLKKVAEKDNS